MVPEPAEQWARVRSVLDLVAEGNGGFLEDLRPRASTVTMFGLEHIPLSTFRALLTRFRGDNARALELVD